MAGACRSWFATSHHLNRAVRSPNLWPPNVTSHPLELVIRIALQEIQSASHVRSELLHVGDGRPVRPGPILVAIPAQ